jgi:hypothetical protein
MYLSRQDNDLICLLNSFSLGIIIFHGHVSGNIFGDNSLPRFPKVSAYILIFHQLNLSFESLAMSL